MGFAVVHMQKFGKGGIRGIQSHNNREKPSRTNPDIDYSKSQENYDLIHSNSYQKDIKSVIDKFATDTKTVRKDAVVYCSFIVTSDEKTMKDMSPEKQRAFFEDSIKWFANRYGGENIVNATVHVDEKTPHMHIGVVPISDNRLSAKKLFDRKELTAIQTDFVKEVGYKYGLERGKEGSERYHLSEQRFKLETAKRELQATADKTKEIASTAQNLLVKEQKVKSSINTLKQHEKALEGQINALEGHIKNAKELKINEIVSISPSKTLTGSIKGVSIEDIENLKKAALMSVKALESVKSLSQENERLKNRIAGLEQHTPSIVERISEAKEKSKLLEIEKAFNKLPIDTQKQLLSDRGKSDDLNHYR